RSAQGHIAAREIALHARDRRRLDHLAVARRGPLRRVVALHARRRPHVGGRRKDQGGEENHQLISGALSPHIASTWIAFRHHCAVLLVDTPGTSSIAARYSAHSTLRVE